ncbi:hypothetical protein, partial [Bilophila wadsworthia]|uniref:hypothetical protein n=1 Tax=Bilophila wadsworthia TaxID=35833 RepID=UPI002431BE8D
PRTPPPHPPKTFLFIESLFAAFPVDEGTALQEKRKRPIRVCCCWQTGMGFWVYIKKIIQRLTLSKKHCRE